MSRSVRYGSSDSNLNNPSDDLDLLSDDDNQSNASSDIDTGAESPSSEKEAADPLLLAIEDLESRTVECLNDFKSHPGTATTGGGSKQNIHEELASLLRPVLEIAAHVGPSTARSICSTYGSYDLDSTIDEIYNRLNSDLILPVLLETAQSDTIPAKRAASLSFFSSLFRECQKGGSYLDKSTTTIPTLLGPYGPGGGGQHHQQHQLSMNIPPSMRPLLKLRANKRSLRQAELLRYWVQSSIPSLTPGTYTSFTSDASAASRGVLSASSSIKPSLRHIAERISNADDAGALRLFLPVMRMIGGVLHRLFLQGGKHHGGGGESSIHMESSDAALRSSCIKFVEIVVLCFSSKVQQGGDVGGAQQQSRRRGQNLDDFSLEDLPTGHPIITRESLEEIGEYAFTTLRGLTIIGGQVKIDSNLLPDILSSTQGFFEGGGGGYGSSPSTQIVSIIKPAALAYLEVESSVMESEGGEFKIDRRDLELDFSLSQKSYALTINAVSMLATNRPIFFKDSATCLARRTMDPPTYDDSASNSNISSLSKTAVTGVQSHLKASCLTLLRHSLSVTSGGWETLHRALSSVGMELQANKAYAAAKQQAALKTAGRAARNRAAIFYEWDQSEEVKRVSKRQRATDDALAQMRAAKAAKGLGNGVQLPASMVDACELVLLNLRYLPSQRPGAGGSSSVTRKKPINLDFVVDAVMTNGASLVADESRWYDRNGGAAWSMTVTSEDKTSVAEGKKDVCFKLESKALQAASLAREGKEGGKESDEAKIFVDQCQTAASDAFSRIVLRASSARSKSLGDIGNQIAARLAWTLRGVQPSSALKSSLDFSVESVSRATQSDSNEKDTNNPLIEFAKDRPLVASCLALDIVSSGGSGGVNAVNNNTGGAGSQQKGTPTGSTLAGSASSLANRILNEAYMQSFGSEQDCADTNKELYAKSLDVFVSSVVHACNRANEKPNDNDRKRAATLAASSMPQQLAVVPSATPSAFRIASSLCDIDAVNKKAADIARKASHQTIAASSAAHAAKAAAETRATKALLALRDAAIQRSKPDMRRSAVDCAVAITAGRLPGSPSVEDKALKLVMNVLFPKSTELANAVVSSATEELERAAMYAIENYEKIQRANKAVLAKKKSGDHYNNKNALQPISDEENVAMERVRKPAVLFMALCVRRPEIIVTLMRVSSKEGADVLSKAVRNNMYKLAGTAAKKHGAAAIALRVSDMIQEKEIPLLLAFLDNLAQSSDNALPSQELIDACHEIQRKRLDAKGKKDARYVIPIVSGVKREELVGKLPEFVSADDRVFKAALIRMSERLGRHALVFRDEPDKENPSLNGMTLCEQMVFLHRLDFRGVGLPQKRYLEAIRNCLEEDEIFTDRVIMAALDYMSGAFLAGEDGLPLAYMRTIILTCSKHESLHSWICHVLLPRLIEGKIYTDRRQWEGWMRCAKMLENTGAAGVSSIKEAIQNLPEEQLEMYLAIRNA